MTEAAWPSIGAMCTIGTIITALSGVATSQRWVGVRREQAARLIAWYAAAADRTYRKASTRQATAVGSTSPRSNST